jgi:hypothetical protein
MAGSMFTLLSLLRLDKHVDKPGQVLYGQRKSLIYKESSCHAHFLGMPGAVFIPLCAGQLCG